MDKPSSMAKFLIDAPLLEDIELHNYSAFYCFVKHPSMLNKVYVSFYDSVFSERIFSTHMQELLRGISSVKSIHLMNNLALFDAIKRNANVWSMFHNLTHFNLDVSTENVGSSSSIPTCFLSRLKVIELRIKEGNYCEIYCDVNLVKYILRKSVSLEELHVFCLPKSDDDDTEVSKIQCGRNTNFVGNCSRWKGNLSSVRLCFMVLTSLCRVIALRKDQ